MPQVECPISESEPITLDEKVEELFVQHMCGFTHKFIEELGEMYKEYNKDIEKLGRQKIYGQVFVDSVNDIIKCMVEKLPK